jgi:hypothetical protein
MSGTLELHARYATEQIGTIAGGELYSISSSMQRKTFYAKGLHWVFFYKQNKMWYSFSSDGLSWAAPIFLVDNPNGWGDLFSIHFDGTFLHYVRATEPVTPSLGTWYRRGVPNNDGTISWSTEEQKIPDLSDVYTPFPVITVDSDGYPWVGCYSEYGPQQLESIPTVCKCAQKNGSWISNASGFPYYLNSQRRYTGVILVPLTLGKVYALYFRSFPKYMQPLPTTPIYGRLWDGASWGMEENMSISNVANEAFNMISAIADEDDVHVTFLKDLTFEIVHVKRTSAWSAEEVVHTATAKSSPILALRRSQRIPQCFWIQDNSILYKNYVDSKWSELFELALETNSITENEKITCSYEDYESIIGVAWFLDSINLIRYSYVRAS